MFISNDPDDLFYQVPRRILSFIDGCPSKLMLIMIDFDIENDRLIVCANEEEDKRDRFTVSFPFEKLYKIFSGEGINVDEITENLFAIHDR